MLFTAEWISRVFPDYQGLDKTQIINEVTTDSRVETTNSLFIPLIGEHFNGHAYAGQALKQGAVALLWDRSYELPEDIDEGIIAFFVDDTLKAMQKLAVKYRDEINPTVIGITGSNGKTTTKDMVHQVVGSSFQTHYTEGNLNNHIGVPLTILGMERDTEVLILEMGMNHFGEIERLSMIAKPDYAIITNIGESHIEFLGSREGIARAKLEITAGLKKTGSLLIDGDETLLSDIESSAHVITCGFRDHNEVIASQPVMGTHDMSFTLSGSHTYTIPLLGKHNALNAAFAITIGKCLDMNKQLISSALETFEQTAMRFERVSGPNDVALINDAYNASPTSMKAAIEVIKQLPGYNNKVLVLGDILELGEDSANFHQSVAQVISNEITAVFTYGNDAKEIANGLEKTSQKVIRKHFDTKDSLIEALYPYLTHDTVILFKASRKMQLETLIESVRKRA